ncbi:uncharacterized protein LOC129602863 [Paramacrobiotus metropolitanus]|uniref:uncharacterized protein LOC129602863 n=1 Tax=Paramacrobiotus metropolitanus TaxID=2943436 RepID=UPI002445F785|nr:uncharacterized protein LOC129602863 [Paramacrobiotus metropolitanus]
MNSDNFSISETLTVILRNESRKRLFRDISLTQTLFGPIFFIMFAVVLHVQLPTALYFVTWMTLTGLIGFCFTHFLMPKTSAHPSLVPCLYICMLSCGLALGVATVVQGTLLLTSPHLRKNTKITGSRIADGPEVAGLGPAIGIGALLTSLELVAVIMVIRDLIGCSRYGLPQSRRNLTDTRPIIRTTVDYRIVRDPRGLAIGLPTELHALNALKMDSPPGYDQIPPPTYDEAVQTEEMAGEQTPRNTT